jgi:hypothetical protein
VAGPSSAVVDVVHEERYWYPDDGGQVWVAGFTPVDADGRFLGRAAPELAARGLRVVPVAGARHQGAALDDDALAPGRLLALRREPANPHDANAIAVHAAGTAGVQAGWVPREVAAELAAPLDAGEAWSAVVLRESRPSPREPRSGLVALLARAPGLELRVRPSRRHEA